MEKKKIFLISANPFTAPYPVYPLGISYISAYLKKKLPHFEIKVFDYILNNLDELIIELKIYQADYVGISLRNIDNVNSYDEQGFIATYKTILDSVRNNSKAKIIIGGAGYSIFPEFIFDSLQPDFAIRGEGEKSFAELILCLDEGNDFKNIEGLVYKDNDNICLNNRNHFLTDPGIEFDNRLIDFYWKNSGMLNIQTKRGCPYKCIYCTYPLIEGTKVRTLDTDTIIANLSELYHKKAIDYVFFTDSVFNISNEYNIKLAEQIIKSDLNIRWGAYFSPHNLDEDMLKLFKASGLTHIEFGTEALSDKTLENYGKHFTVADIIDKSAICRKHDVNYAHFLILGGYGETEETLNETFENSKKIFNSVFFPFVGMRIYPGTPLYDYAIADGVISKDDNLLEPKYYISDKINKDTLKSRAKATGKRWVFPDEDYSAISNKLRLKRNKKGPLWEYLTQE